MPFNCLSIRYKVRNTDATKAIVGENGRRSCHCGAKCLIAETSPRGGYMRYSSVVGDSDLQGFPATQLEVLSGPDEVVYGEKRHFWF